MKIAIVTTWFPAGAGYVSKAFMKIMEKENDVFIYARGGKRMIDDNNWDLDNVSWAPSHYNDIKVNHFLKWLENNKIDVILFNEQRFWKPVLKAKKAGYCVGAYIDYYTQQTVSGFKIYDFLICNTKRHFSVFNWHEDAYYVPWGTKLKGKKTRKIKRDKDEVTFIISAGWQPKYTGDRRGTLLALEAFKKVEGNCKLIVYSQVDYEHALPIWQKLLKDNLNVLLKVGTLEPFPYEEGDVYVYPSRLDGIGLTLPEAIAHGLASITTNSAPMNEFVRDNYNGLLVNVERYLGRADGYYWAESICEIESLRCAMQRYVDNRDVLESHKKNAENFAKKHLDWEKNSIELNKIIHEVFIKEKNTISKELEFKLTELDRLFAPTISYKLLSAIRFFLKNFHVG